MGAGASTGNPVTSSSPVLSPQSEQPGGTPVVVFVIGAPGTGKDTLCERLAAKYNCTHLSPGDLLRHEVASDSAQGKEISVMIHSGQVVPSQVIIDMLKAAMARSGGPFLISGFPKTIESLEAFEAQCCTCTGALCLYGDEQALTVRLAERDKASGTHDEASDAIRRRFEVFRLQSAQVVQALEQRGTLRHANAAPPLDKVFNAACEFYDHELMAKS